MTRAPGSRRVGAAESARANRRWWDRAAEDYYAEHGQFLGDVDLLWCPEGLRESAIGLLGEVRGRRVLELGCGAAQGARWAAAAGAHIAGIDVSMRQLIKARELDLRTGTSVPLLVQGDAQRLPFAGGSFDVVFSAFGAVPFVADSEAVMHEVCRVLRPGARFVFAVTHPTRWAFPDDPGPAGLTVQQSYFDRSPYVEVDEAGDLSYVEHHRTLGDRIRELVAAGLTLLDLVEPEWPAGHEQEWGQWSPLRGRLMPGTAIFVTRKPA